MGRYDEALSEFDRAIELNPGSDWALAHRGQIHRLLGRYDEALADFTHVLELDPHDQWAIASRGEIDRLMGRLEAALADFNQAIELWPEAAWIVAERQETTTSEPGGRALTRRLAVECHLPSWALVFRAAAA